MSSTLHQPPTGQRRPLTVSRLLVAIALLIVAAIVVLELNGGRANGLYIAFGLVASAGFLRWFDRAWSRTFPDHLDE